MVFDQTNGKRKAFVQYFKKYREQTLIAAVDEFSNLGRFTPSLIGHLFRNQNSPAKLWDNLSCDEDRQGIFNSLISSLSLTQIDLNEQIAELDSLRSELKLIPDIDPLSLSDEEDDDDDGDDSNDLQDIVLYHVSPISNLHLIITDGLRSMSRRNVYFWESQKEALEIAKERHPGASGYAVFSISRSELELNGIKVLKNDFGFGDQWYVVDHVPSKYVVFQSKVY